MPPPPPPPPRAPSGAFTPAFLLSPSSALTPSPAPPSSSVPPVAPTRTCTQGDIADDELNPFISSASASARPGASPAPPQDLDPFSGVVPDYDTLDAASAHAPTQTLVQMLAMVGTTLLTADRSGLLPLGTAPPSPSLTPAPAPVELQPGPDPDPEHDPEPDPGQDVDQELDPDEGPEMEVLDALAYLPGDPASTSTKTQAQPLPKSKAEAPAEEQLSASSLALSSCPLGDLPSSVTFGRDLGLGEEPKFLEPARDDSQLLPQSDPPSPLDFPRSLQSSSGPQDRTEALRNQLADKVRRVFSLPRSEQLQSYHGCWLYRATLFLKGYAYLTSSYLCFYAPLPKSSAYTPGGTGDTASATFHTGATRHAGSLLKRTRRTHRWTRHWVVLRDQYLAWFESAHDPYFPQNHLDLRTVSHVGPVATSPTRTEPDSSTSAGASAGASQASSSEFTVDIPGRTYLFCAPSPVSRDAWVDALTKAVFRAQTGDSVRITIPLETILDVEENTLLPGAETPSGGQKDRSSPSHADASMSDVVAIQVAEGDNEYALDEFHFFHFSSRHDRLIDRLNHALHECAPPPKASEPSEAKVEQEGSVSEHLGVSLEGTQPINIPRAVAAATSETLDGSGGSHPSYSVTPRQSTILRPPSLLSAPSSPWSGTPPPSGTQWSATGKVTRWVSRSSSSAKRFLRRAPSAAQAAVLGPRTRLGALVLGTLSETERQARKVHEVWDHPGAPIIGQLRGEQIRPALATLQAGDSLDQPDSWSESSEVYAVMSPPEEGRVHDPVPPEKAAAFHRAFPFARKESIQLTTRCYLYRVIPTRGRLWITDRHLCFQSSGLATSTLGRTLMQLPLADVISVTRHHALQPNTHGLIVVVRGHEEIFLEFATLGAREAAVQTIQQLLDSVQDDDPDRERARDLARDGDNSAGEELRLDALTAEFAAATRNEGDSSLASSQASLGAGEAEPSAHSGLDSNASSGVLSGISFHSSAMLQFQPPKPLHFTLLTIGSRGDVQPYIALAKALQHDGHRVRIATHAEFGPWVESLGIDFYGIGGDPAELMRVCVDNGTFSLGFLREGVTKFRGWLDDLLDSAWQACQGTEVIIEAPSAIAGIHIAAALQVPYFRAFTMPWSRTRAYPHAFAVPGHRAGGSFNYLTHVIFDQVFWRASASQINQWRRDRLGIPPTSYEALAAHRVPFLYNFSPAVVPKPLDWPEWIHVTGYWFLDNPLDWQPPADLVDFIAQARRENRKLVYIGWGSIVVQDAQAMDICVAEAVRISGVRAIVSRGWSDRLSSAPLSDDPSPLAANTDIFRVDAVPHDWLFPQLDAACHHGGSGTVGASLRAGIPTVIKPYFGDQFFWANQVEALGVGTHVRNGTPRELAKALDRATSDQSQVERAHRLGRRIRDERGTQTAVQTIYRELEYARSLITPLPKRETEGTHAEYTVDPQAELEYTADPAEGSDETDPSLPGDKVEHVPPEDQSGDPAGDQAGDPAGDPADDQAGEAGIDRSPSHSRSSSGSSHWSIL